MPKLHDKIYYAIIWRQNRLALKWADENRVTIDQGLYRGAIQLLHHAVRYRNYSFASSLLNRGVEVDCLDGLGQTALQDAAQRGHLGGMKWLIRHGADLESQQDELLLGAVRCGQLHVINWLLDQGCDVNAVREDKQNPLVHCYKQCDDKDRERTAALLRRHGAEFPPSYVSDVD